MPSDDHSLKPSKRHAWPGDMDQEEALQRYVDGALDAAQRAEVEAVLATDPSLKADAQSLQQLGEIMRGHFAEASAGLDTDALFGDLEARLARSTEPPAGEVVSLAAARRRRAPVYVGAAALAAVAALMLVYWAPDDAPENAPVAGLESDVPKVPKYRKPKRERNAYAANESAEPTEVIKVDFGDHTGTVFTDAEHAVAVVWVDE